MVIYWCFRHVSFPLLKWRAAVQSGMRLIVIHVSNQKSDDNGRLIFAQAGALFCFMVTAFLNAAKRAPREIL